jgi:type II secretory pathway component GspD/PulD (secretin)
VLGGFLSREKSSDQDGLPGLSRIPVLGKAFGVEREISRQTELAIFVTPVVVDAQHPEMLARISNGQKIVSEAFPEPPRLNYPIAHSQSAPYSGAASQWETVDQAAQQGGASQWESSN